MINGINHITLSVRDINESFKFYKNVLFLTPIMLSSQSAYCKAGDIWIALHEEKAINRYNESYTHFAFNVEQDSFNIIIMKLEEEGVNIWQKNHTEGDSFYFEDPSGNKLEIHYATLNDRIEYGKEHWDKNVKWFI